MKDVLEVSTGESSLDEFRDSKIDTNIQPTEFIFDTNTYRTLVHELSMGEVISLAERLNRQEETSGYNSAVSIVVLMELIQHLLVNDPARVDCYKALCMAFHHTSKIDIQKKMRSGFYYPPLNIILSQFFFNSDSKYRQLYDRVVNLFIELVKEYDIEVCKKFESDIKAVKSQIIFEKEEFKKNVECFLTYLNNGTLDWQYINKNKEERDKFFKKMRNGEITVLLAYSLMLRAHQVMDAEELISDAENKIQKFLKEYHAAILMNLTLLESIGQGAEKLKEVSDARWNTLNVVQIMFALLFVKNGFPEKILVTQEKKIKESAIKADVGDKVMTIIEYQKFIGFSQLAKY